MIQSTSSLIDIVYSSNSQARDIMNHVDLSSK